MYYNQLISCFSLFHFIHVLSVPYVLLAQKAFFKYVRLPF